MGAEIEREGRASAFRAAYTHTHTHFWREIGGERSPHLGADVLEDELILDDGTDEASNREIAAKPRRLALYLGDYVTIFAPVLDWNETGPGSIRGGNAFHGFETCFAGSDRL